jgi:transposase
MTSRVLGIDMAKEKFDVCLLTEGRTRHHVFPNSPAGFQALASWLDKHHHSVVHACLEATGTYGEDLALFLYEAHHTVSIVNPAQIKAFGESELRRAKTDKMDAALIARYCERQQPPAWTPPAPELRELQALVRRLESLQQIHTQESNRLSSGVRSPAVAESIQDTLAFLEAEIAKIEGQIKDHIDQHPSLKHKRDLLRSIQGIGDKTAAALLAEFPEIESFASARQLAAYAGVTPEPHESGRSVHRKAQMSRRGSSRVRKILYFPAIVAMTHNALVRPFCQRLRERGKPGMAIIVAAMRKLIHLVYGVLKSGRPFDPHYGQATA